MQQVSASEFDCDFKNRRALNCSAGRATVFWLCMWLCCPCPGKDSIVAEDGNPAGTKKELYSFAGKLKGYLPQTGKFSPDGRTLVTFGDQEVFLWDTDTLRLRRSLSCKEPKNCRFVAAGKVLYVTSFAEECKFWDVATGKLLSTFPSNRLFDALPSPDGSLLTTGEIVWDVARHATIATLQHRDAVVFAVFSPDGARLATQESPTGALVLDKGESRFHSFAFDAKGSTVALGRESGPRKGTEVWKLTGTPAEPKPQPAQENR